MATYRFRAEFIVEADSLDEAEEKFSWMCHENWHVEEIEESEGSSDTSRGDR